MLGTAVDAGEVVVGRDMTDVVANTITAVHVHFRRCTAAEWAGASRDFGFDVDDADWIHRDARAEDLTREDTTAARQSAHGELRSADDVVGAGAQVCAGFGRAIRLKTEVLGECAGAQCAVVNVECAAEARLSAARERRNAV